MPFDKYVSPKRDQLALMEALIDYLLLFGQLNEQQIRLIKQHIKPLDLAKDAYFSEAGKVPRQVGFILEGILRVCYYNSQGEDITRYFMDENNFVVDINSFNQRLPSSEYLQAVTPCSLLVFSADSMAELSATIIGWDEIISKITAKALWQKIDRISPMLSVDATTRYNDFITKFPNLANRIPLVYIASYLGVTQSSLSRIRRNS